MRFQFSFRHLDASQRLRNYTERKLRDRIDKFDRNSLRASIGFAKDGPQCTTHCVVVDSKGRRYEAQQTEREDFLASIDGVTNKLAEQMRREKDRQHSRRIHQWEEYLRTTEASECMCYEHASDNNESQYPDRP